MATRKLKLSICIILIMLFAGAYFFLALGYNKRPLQAVKPPPEVAVCEPVGK